ncbi:MAG: 50S ribosomal protein L7/L12 [Ardenticatenaceae bacterium]
MADLSALVEQLDNLTLLEAAQLSKMLQEKWGVSAAAPVAVAAGPGGGGAAAPVEAEEEQTEFNVILTGFEGNKIKVIKAVRKLTGLGLREAKAAVEDAPTTVREAVSKEEAETAKAELEKDGGKVEIK